MNIIQPINQLKLYGLDNYINELINLYNQKTLPNKILLSGLKGQGKSTLAYHFINYVLSENEEFKYNINNLEIDPKNRSYKTALNRSNQNLITIDLENDKKFIDINQIRQLILNLNKSSFNNKPRFVLIDNIEYLNTNSINALLKIVEEPSSKINFILINNNKKILKTLLSRCINFKISLTNKENLFIADKLLNGNLFNIINKNLINYYFTPGNVYNLWQFSEITKYDLSKISLKEFLTFIIKNNYYKKNNFIGYLIFDLIELYFTQINLNLSSQISDKYSFFLKRISETKRFNLDQDSLFMEFDEKILNG